MMQSQVFNVVFVSYMTSQQESKSLFLTVLSFAVSFVYLGIGALLSLCLNNNSPADFLNENVAEHISVAL